MISSLVELRTSFFGQYKGCALDDVSCSTAAASYYCGFFDSLSAFFACIMLPIYGYLSDKYGRKPFLLLTAFACCIPRVALTLPDNLWIYYSSAVLCSALGGDGGPVWNSYISDTSEHEERVNAYAAFAAVMMIGIAFMPSVGTWLESMYGWDNLIYLSVVLTAMAVIYVAIFVPETLSRRAERLCQAKPVSWMYLASPTKSPMVSYCLWTVLYTTLPMGAMAEIFLLYLNHTLRFDSQLTSSFLLALGLTGFVANMVVLPFLVGQRWSEFSLIVLGLGSCVAYYAALAFVQTPEQTFYCLILTIPTYFLQPVISTLISEHASAAHQGQAQGIKSAADGVCSTIAPVITGYVFSYLSQAGSPRLICLVNAGIVLFGLFVTLFHYPSAMSRQREISAFELKLSLSPSMDSNMASYSELNQPLLD
jgi:DHA1 family tetracycline resistance protein-like MFS transporter